MADHERTSIELQDLKQIAAIKRADKAAGVGLVLGAVLAITGIVLSAPNPQATDGNEVLFMLACASLFVLPLLLGVAFYKWQIKSLADGA